jgi:hypothetical protein
MLRTSRINNKLLAYAILEGPFNFDKTPLALPGTKAIIYNDPKTRTSWGPHGDDAYYLNRAPEHWRCYKFYVPETKSFRISGAATFFPSHCKMPTVDPGDTIRLAAQDLITALKNPHPNAPIDLEPRHNQALRELSDIFQASIKQTSEGETESPRVASEPSTSHDATALRVIRLAPASINTKHDATRQCCNQFKKTFNHAPIPAKLPNNLMPERNGGGQEQVCVKKKSKR